MRAARRRRGERFWLMDYGKAFAQALQALKIRGPLPRVRRHPARPGPVPGRAALRRWRRPADHRLVLERLSRHGPAPGVIAAMDEALTRVGAGSGGTRNISGNTIIMSSWRPSSPTCTARKRPCCSPRATSPTRRRSRPCKAAARLHHLLGRQEPRLDDRRHPQRRLREADLPPQRPRPSRGSC